MAGLLTVADVAEMLSVSTRTVRRYTSTGDLPHVRVGRNVRFRLRDVEVFTEERLVSKKDLDRLARKRIVGN